MLFSRIIIPEDIADVENKLRLNLSKHAFYVLNYDIEAFRAGEVNDNRISSSMINRIFSCYKDAAASSVSLAIRTRYEEIIAALKDIPESDQATEKLVAIYRQELLEYLQKRLEDCGRPFSIRVDAANLEYLRSEEGYAESIYYDDRVGRYLKAVIEEYCEQPYAVRERIYYRDNLNAAIRAIKEEKVLKLRLHSKSNVKARAQNNILYMKPVCIEEDSEHLYTYIAGMIGHSQGGPWEPGAVRLTSIKTAECQEKSGFLSSDDQKYIRSEIKNRGIQYLSANSGITNITVMFTEEGEKLYKRIMHLRPQYTAKTGLKYEFQCTLAQAENYFFKFGHNVKILEPQTLADKFVRRYESALKQYK